MEDITLFDAMEAIDDLIDEAYDDAYDDAYYYDESGGYTSRNRREQTQQGKMQRRVDKLGNIANRYKELNRLVNIRNTPKADKEKYRSEMKRLENDYKQIRQSATNKSKTLGGFDMTINKDLKDLLKSDPELKTFNRKINSSSDLNKGRISELKEDLYGYQRDRSERKRKRAQGIQDELTKVKDDNVRNLGRYYDAMGDFNKLQYKYSAANAENKSLRHKYDDLKSEYDDVNDLYTRAKDRNRRLSDTNTKLNSQYDKLKAFNDQAVNSNRYHQKMYVNALKKNTKLEDDNNKLSKNNKKLKIGAAAGLGIAGAGTTIAIVYRRKMKKLQKELEQAYAERDQAKISKLENAIAKLKAKVPFGSKGAVGESYYDDDYYYDTYDDYYEGYDDIYDDDYYEGYDEYDYYDDVENKVIDAYVEGVIDDDEFDTYMDYLNIDNYY